MMLDVAMQNLGFPLTIHRQIIRHFHLSCPESLSLNVPPKESAEFSP